MKMMTSSLGSVHIRMITVKSCLGRIVQNNLVNKVLEIKDFSSPLPKHMQTYSVSFPSELQSQVSLTLLNKPPALLTRPSTVNADTHHRGDQPSEPLLSGPASLVTRVPHHWSMAKQVSGSAYGGSLHDRAEPINLLQIDRGESPVET